MSKLTHFSGSTPPEIFIGHKNYPEINAGILAPIEYGDTEKFSMPELWFKNQLQIKEILSYRNQLLHARFKTNIKTSMISEAGNPEKNKLTSALNQIALAKKSVLAEFFLSKPVSFEKIKESSVAPIGNPAPLKKIILEENPKIIPKLEYISNDIKLKSIDGINELYKSKIPVSNIIKILSAGLLGLKKNRKMVPTRWAITATDDTISKQMLEKIRFFPEINDFQVFEGNYLGNYYEILLLPDKFSFEVIEISELNPSESWHDFETFYGRKNYASSVTGAYYANRLALCEHLTKIQRQASAIFFREIRPEYNSPMGVGILREVTRNAFTNPRQKFQALKEALTHIKAQLHTDISYYKKQSHILNNFGKQKRLSSWF